jgi:hypothetical protein
MSEDIDERKLLYIKASGCSREISSLRFSVLLTASCELCVRLFRGSQCITSGSISGNHKQVVPRALDLYFCIHVASNAPYAYSHDIHR